MSTPIAVFPGAVVTDAQLKVANNQIQTTLSVACAATDTVLFVTSVVGFVPNCLVSIDKEILAIVSVQGAPNNALTVAPSGRGFDATIAAQHAVGATVAMLIDAWHHNVLAKEIEAIEATLGRNLTNVSGGATTPQNFCQSPGGTLVIGANTITLSPVPIGVNGSDTYHNLWIADSAGGSEAVLITGGTAVSGAASGTLTFTCVYAHTGSWSICSATAGIQEAIQLLATAAVGTMGVGGVVAIPTGNLPIHAPIIVIQSYITLRGNGRGASVLLADSSVTPVVQVGTTATEGFGVQLMWLTVSRQSGIPTGVIGVNWYWFNLCYSIGVEIRGHYIGEYLTWPFATPGVVDIGYYSLFGYYWGNSYAHIQCDKVAGVQYDSLYMGGNTSVLPNPTYAVIISSSANSIVFVGVQWLMAGSAPNLTQWGVFFQGVTNATGVFYFLDCNAENLGQGFITSDASTPIITDLQWIGGRAGIGSLPFISLNAASSLRFSRIQNSNISGQINITNGAQNIIMGNYIGQPMTINGGTMLVANNTFTSSPWFGGNFGCLNLGPNTYAFNGSAQLAPDLTTATGRVYVDANNAQDAASSIPAGNPTGPTTASAATITPPSSVFTITGTTPVTVINHPWLEFEGTITMIPSAAVPFQTGGNIMNAITATPNVPVIAVCSRASGTPQWYLK